jgi:hypothetical protein
MSAYNQLWPVKQQLLIDPFQLFIQQINTSTTLVISAFILDTRHESNKKISNTEARRIEEPKKISNTEARWIGEPGTQTPYLPDATLRGNWLAP